MTHPDYSLPSLLFLALFMLYLVRRYASSATPKANQVAISPNRGYVQKAGALSHIRALKGSNETIVALQELIARDGAQSWPPRVSHGEAWPKALQAYHTIWHTMAPKLVHRDFLTRGDANIVRCRQFREEMQILLREMADIAAVERVLYGTDKGTLSQEACNGFFSCISFCRHAYRWGSSPVVREIQEEKLIQLPLELDIPWQFLKQRYGIWSPGGNLTCNFLHNWSSEGELLYSINPGKEDIILTTEHYFTKVVTVMEGYAVPMYLHIVKSIDAYYKGQKDACLQSLQVVHKSLRDALGVYYDTFVSAKVSEKVWGTHIQGFHGWAAGDLNDTEYVEYDGVSGSQTLFVQVIDAFLGMPQYDTEEEALRHMPLCQRQLINSVRRQSFRHKAIENNETEIEASMYNMVKVMRVFRTSHRKRSRVYLSVETPERKVMTAGNSILENEERKTRVDAVNYLDAFLDERLRQTK